MIGFVINLERRLDKLEYVFGHLYYHRDIIFPTRFNAFEGGWRGCRDSHLEILNFGRRLGYPFCIFEDDVAFLGTNDEIILDAMGELPEDWSCLYLGASPQEEQKQYSEHLYRISKSYCMHAVIWNPKSKAIEYMLEHRSEIGKIDVYMSEEIFPRFNCFLVKPLLVVQKQFQSDTCGRSDVSTIPLQYAKYCH